MAKLIKYLLFFIHVFMVVEAVLADGSKDLYPRGIRGNRAFLISRPENQGNINFPFPNMGTHYVYLRTGETLAVASSAIYMDHGRIDVLKPNGVRLFRDGNTATGDGNFDLGLIKDKGNGTREAELAGPRVGYDAWEIIVGDGEEGVWRVDFTAPEIDVYARDIPEIEQGLADNNWNQARNFGVAAWDVSVRDATDQHWISGRVYTNVMSLQINSGLMSNASGAFYGVNYVLTNDGYVYKIDANGSNGIAYSYFVNNKGFIDGSGNPIYRSVNSVQYIMYGGVHDPRKQDTEHLVTHKIMYTLPDLTMPEVSTGVVPGGSTWLITPKRDAEITNIQIHGIEGGNMVMYKGAYISFDTNLKSSYKIQIRSHLPEFSFADRDIIVDAEPGTNRFYWNGLDGNGNFMPVGENYPITLNIELLGGEIHFPYIDMEINPNGILISRLTDDLLNESDAIVYWDDSDIPNGMPSENPYPKVNLQGIPSSVNGHRWGTYSDITINQNTNNNYGHYSYGNNMAIDTWSYSLSLSEMILPGITVAIADLLIQRVEVDKDTIELDEDVTYRIVVKNDGPSDAIGATFNYALPVGFVINHLDVETSCGQVITRRIVDNNRINATVNLPDQCELVFVVRAAATANVSDETYGFYETISDVIRPAGITDPDATSTNINLSTPSSALDECSGNDLCNNIMLHKGVFLLEPYNERGQLALIKSVEHLDANEDGYHQAGEQVRYTFILKNIGEAYVSDIALWDGMLSNTLIDFDRKDLSSGEEIHLSLSYTITQEDLDRGRLVNTATVLGKNRRGFDVKDISGTNESNDLPTKLDLFERPNIYLKKTVSNRGTGESGQFTVGDVIEYRFDITNRDIFMVYDAIVEDPLLINSQVDVGDLSVEQSIEAYGYYEVTLSDIDRGYVENTAWLIAIDSRNNQRIRVQSGTSFDNVEPTVTQLAKPPQGREDDFIQYMNSAVSYYVLENDIAGSSSIQRGIIEIISYPTHGTVQVEYDGHVTYMPNTGFIGEDSFRYRFSDASRLLSNITDINIVVIPTEVVSVEDYFELEYNRYVDLDVLRNDYTVGGSILDISSLELINLPSNGILTTEADGFVRYTPNANFTGVDYFSYRVQDSNGIWSETATVTLLTKGMLIPNVITPNGDGNNDTFAILGMYAFERIQLEVIDRFGKPIYNSENYKNDWAAEGHEDGAYYYIIKGFSQGRQIFYEKGMLTVIRMFNY